MSGDATARLVEHERRVTQVRELLERRGAASCLLTSRKNFAWITAGGANHVVLASEQGAAPLLVTWDEVVLLAPVNEAARVAVEELDGLPIEVVSLDWFDADAAAAEARRRTPGEPLSDDALDAELTTLRSVLSPFDRERLAWLGGAARDALESAVGGVRAGDTEDAVVGRLVGRLAGEGIRVPVCLAAADGRIERYRHPLPTATRVERRLMAVIVAERWGLHVAATRFAELDAPSGELAARLDATRAVQRAMHEATQPGRTLGDVLEAARAAYRDTGFAEEWQLHHQGGTIAYRGRERIAVPGDATRIEPGMAFAWNPSITGAKVEDTFVLEEDGSRRLVTA